MKNCFENYWKNATEPIYLSKIVGKLVSFCHAEAVGGFHLFIYLINWYFLVKIVSTAT